MHSRANQTHTIPLYWTLHNQQSSYNSSNILYRTLYFKIICKKFSNLPKGKIKQCYPYPQKVRDVTMAGLAYIRCLTPEGY